MHKIQQQEAEKIKEMRKKVKDKKEDKRLYAVQLRAERKTNQEIAEKLDTSDRVVSNWRRNKKRNSNQHNRLQSL